MKFFLVGFVGACVLVVGANYAAATPWALPYALAAVLLVFGGDRVVSLRSRFRHRGPRDRGRWLA